MDTIKIFSEIEWHGGIAVKDWSRLNPVFDNLDAKGVYIVVRTSNESPEFLPSNPTPELRGRKHSETKEQLADLWVAESSVIYIGKAGGMGQKATLRKRLNAYIKHGFELKKYSHWGGRLVWQVSGSQNFLIYWHNTAHQEPSVVESSLIAQFKMKYQKRPFANLRS